MPRLDTIVKEQERAAATLDRARQAVDAEERRQREVRGRLDQYRQLEERNQAQLHAVTSAREATAATAQLDQARKMIGEAQRELDGISHRLTDLRHAVTDSDHALRDIERAQKELRASLDADRATIEAQLAELHKHRDERGERPAVSACPLRPHSFTQTCPRRLPATRALVRQLRYRAAVAAAK